MNFSGKYIVITGGTSGIGKALALSFAKQQAIVLIVGSNEAKLLSVANELANLTTVYTIQTDFADTKQTALLGEQILTKIPHVDVLIHAAGIMHVGAFSQITPEELDEQYRINTRAPFVLTQQLLASLRGANGQVVCINSSAAQNVSLNNATYAASKMAFKGLTDGLRMEVNPEVRVLSVYPGRTATPMQEKLFAQEGKAYNPELLLQPEDIAQTVLSALSLPTSAEITDITIRSYKK